MTVAQAEAVLAPAEAKDDAKDDAKDERYAGIVRRMTPELIQECCKERQMWSQPQLNTVLYLNYKGFETIEGLEAYTNLRALHLGNNNIAKIEGLDRMSSLRSLNLDGNRIMCIENLKGNLELRQLSIESNALRQLSNLSHLMKLEQLNVSRNAITKVTDLEELKSVPSLQNIDISHNCIEESEGVVEFWASLPGELKILRFHSNPGLRFIEHYRKRMVNAVPSLRNLDERPIFPVERKASAAWAEGGIQAMQQAKREFLQEQNRQQNSVDPDRREFLTQQRKLALARIEREEQEKRDQAEKEEEEALRQTPVQKGDPQALDAYVKDWKAKVERFGPEVVREQVTLEAQTSSCNHAAKAAAAAIAEAQRKADSHRRMSTAAQHLPRSPTEKAEPKKQMFAPPPRTAASRAAPKSSTAADFKQQSGTADDHADRQFAVLDAAEAEDLPATQREAPAKKGLNLADLGATVVPDLWKDLEEKNKEAELAVDAANAAASEAYRDEKKQSAASGADTELQDLD